MKSAYLVIGCPGSGKSWVCDQLKDQFTYVHHDAHIGMQGDAYVQAILKAAESADKPLLIEAPFSISQIKDPLEAQGFTITPLIIRESDDVISKRYLEREGKPIPQGHLTRQQTYYQRAQEWNAFSGPSSGILQWLKEKAK